MNEKNSFVLYTSYLEQIRLLTDEQAGTLFKAILHYAAHQDLPDMDGMTSMAFSFIKAGIDKDFAKYQKTCEARSEAGKMGGRPPKAKKANGFSEKQTEAKKADNEYEYDNDSELKKKDTDVSKEKATRFLPPTIEEVRAYCAEKGYAVDPERFVDFYESKGWHVGKNKMKDWKAAVRNWARSQREEKTAKGTEKPSGNRFNNFDQRQHDYDSIVFGELRRRANESGT